MTTRRVLGIAAACITLAGWSGQRAQAAPVTYDLIAGELTSFVVNGNPVLAAPVALSDASATIDFDPAVLEMSNLFIEADSVGFSLQSTGSMDLLGTGPTYLLGDGPVQVDADPLHFMANVAGSSVTVGPSGLEIVMTGVGNASGLFATVKIDFDFLAQRTDPGTAAIPEPGSDLLFPAGLALLGLILRMHRPSATC